MRSVSYEGDSVGLCIPFSLLRNDSVNTFSRQQRISIDVVFYAVRVITEEWFISQTVPKYGNLFVCNSLHIGAALT
jgi:hypothetical protein